MKTCLSEKIMVISQKLKFLTTFEKKVSTLFHSFFKAKSILPLKSILTSPYMLSKLYSNDLHEFWRYKHDTNMKKYLYLEKNTFAKFDFFNEFSIVNWWWRYQVWPGRLQRLKSPPQNNCTDEYLIQSFCRNIYKMYSIIRIW